MTVAGNVERDVDALRGGDAGIDFVFQPILGDFPLNDLHIPAIFGAEVATAAGNAEAALGTTGGETAVGSADRATFAEGNLIGFFLGLGLRLGLGWGG